MSGFFCEINDDNIPFKKALFTNNHILEEKSIEINNEIELEYLGKNDKIKITSSRKVFTNKQFDYICIEILDTDKYRNFFKIDNTIFENNNILKNTEIFILQYPYNGKLSHAEGRIIDLTDNMIKYSAPSDFGSSGSPLIKRYQHNLVMGIHFGSDKEKYNFAYPFDVIINDIKSQLNNKNNNIYTENKKINLIYEKKENDKNKCNNIFGSKFIQNNKNNIELVINGKKSELIDKYNLKEGINNIQMIILSKITNLGYMFYDCISLINIEELKNLNTKEVNNFEGMFNGCSSLSDIKS